MKTSKTALKTLLMTAIVSSLTLGAAIAAQETDSKPVTETTPSIEYISVPMPMFRMLTSENKDTEKPKAPDFFIYGSDGQLTPASTNLPELMQNKLKECGKNPDAQNKCTDKQQNPPGKWANEDSMPGAKMANDRKPPRQMEFVLMTPDDFKSLIDKNSDSMNPKATDRRAKMMEKFNDPNNAIEANIDGKAAKVFFFPRPKMAPKSMPNM